MPRSEVINGACLSPKWTRDDSCSIGHPIPSFFGRVKADGSNWVATCEPDDWYTALPLTFRLQRGEMGLLRTSAVDAEGVTIRSHSTLIMSKIEGHCCSGFSAHL